MTNGSPSNTGANTGGAADTSGEGYTDTYNTGNNATDVNKKNDSINNIQKGNSNVQASKSNPMVDTSNKALYGAETDIGCVLGRRFEKVDKNVAYDVFRNKFSNYIGRTMKYGNKVVFSVKE